MELHLQSLHLARTRAMQRYEDATRRGQHHRAVWARRQASAHSRQITLISGGGR